MKLSFRTSPDVNPSGSRVTPQELSVNFPVQSGRLSSLNLTQPLLFKGKIDIFKTFGIP
jgi:hypothetical protein